MGKIHAAAEVQELALPAAKSRVHKAADVEQVDPDGALDTAKAVGARAVHNLSAGFSDEAKGVVGGVHAALKATAARMRADAPIDRDAQFDEFGNQIGGDTSAAAAGGYVEDRDADRAEQKRLAADHPAATGLTDLASVFAPGAGVRLAAQGLGDSEATDAAGLAEDTGVGLASAAATVALSKLGQAVVGKLGGALAKKAAPEAEKAVETAAKAAKGPAPMTPELLESVRAEQAIQPFVRVNGRPLGQVPGRLRAGPAGEMTVNGAPLGQVPAKAGAAPLPLPPPAAAPVPASVSGPAAALPKDGPGFRKTATDLALSAAGDYALGQLGLPFPVLTVLRLGSQAKGGQLGDAVAKLVTSARAAKLSQAAAKVIAERLPQAAATAFLSAYTSDGKEASP